MQITRDIKDFSRNRQQISTLAVYGGSSINKQIKALNRGVQIIAATPGRLLDLLRRGKIDVSAISTVVLDEADELLNMGFQKDLNAIFDTLPKHYNTWLFSATMPESVSHIAKRYMNNPRKITVGAKNAGADNVSHQYLMVKPHDRYSTLKRIIDFHPDMYAIIFCRTRHNTRKIAKKLKHDGYRADAIHGDLSQSKRTRVMGKFRRKNIRLMVATDVASRGIDVDDITHVINYELPDDLEKYTHRSGRTGRAGKSGLCIGMAKPKEKGKIRKLEKTIKKSFERIDIPTAQDARKKQVDERGFERFFINLGKKDNLNPRQLISLINKETDAANINIGQIDIMGSFSFFEADMHFTDKILNAFQHKVKFHGRSVNVEIAKPKKR
jgi:ATP-dependent RNA helicase DeaD